MLDSVTENTLAIQRWKRQGSCSWREHCVGKKQIISRYKAMW